VLLAGLVVTGSLLSISTVLSAPLLPQVNHGSINLRPYGSIAAHSLCFWQNKVYMAGVATSGYGPNIWIINVSNPDSLVYTGGIENGYKAYEVKVVEDTLYVANRATVLHMHDVTDGSLSQSGEHWAQGKFAWNVDVFLDRACLSQDSETRSKLNTFDVANPSNPTVVKTMDMSQHWRTGLTVADCGLYFVCATAGRNSRLPGRI
jgi:hypothetical protein